MIEATALTKRYGSTTAVDDLTFTIPPGRVTGFLGPNGAGKSTTMRMIVGLDAPTSGQVTVNGRRYAEHTRPLHEVGALLEAKAVHTGRSARNHLLAMAATAGIGDRRVDQMIELVGLTSVARRRVGSFSLGMGQRLGIASALLGDPQTIILDEPVNGLDPDGIRWVRELLRELAGEGRTVLLSSHLMSEMALTADHVIIIGRGRLLRDQSMSQFVAQSGSRVVRVVSPDVPRLTDLLERVEQAAVRSTGSDAVEVTGMDAKRIGAIAAGAGVELWELTPQAASLEEAYMELTEHQRDYRSAHGDVDGTTDVREVA